MQALHGAKTLSELAAEHGIHPNMITGWKQRVMEASPTLFEKGKPAQQEDDSPSKDELYQRIGVLEVQLSFLKKKLRE